VLRRVAVLAALIVVLPVGAVVASHGAADTLGSTLGSTLGGLAAIALRDLPRRRPPEPVRAAPAQAQASPAVDTPAAVDAAPPRRRGRQKAVTAAPARGIFVSASTVLRLASAGVVPQGVPVAASGARPAGLRLAGVSALGVGLREGDILTHVLGAPATSVGAVVEAVVGARARNARVISGLFWRDGQSLPLAVEQPYVAPSSYVPAPPTKP
jgi:hypothetical protein